MNPGVNPAIIISVHPSTRQVAICTPQDEGTVAFVVVFLCIIFFMITIASISYFFQRS